MKKYLNFNNFIALLGIFTIFFMFIPAFKIIVEPEGTTPIGYLNGFQAAFGGVSIMYEGVASVKTSACPTLILAFIFSIVGIVLLVLANRYKNFAFLAFIFFATAGIMQSVGCKFINYSINSIGEKAYYYSGYITNMVMYYVIAGLTIISAIGNVVKPKAQEVY